MKLNNQNTGGVKPAPPVHKNDNKYKELIKIHFIEKSHKKRLTCGVTCDILKTVQGTNKIYYKI